MQAKEKQREDDEWNKIEDVLNENARSYQMERVPSPTFEQANILEEQKIPENNYLSHPKEVQQTLDNLLGQQSTTTLSQTNRDMGKRPARSYTTDIDSVDSTPLNILPIKTVLAKNANNTDDLDAIITTLENKISEISRLNNEATNLYSDMSQATIYENVNQDELERLSVLIQRYSSNYRTYTGLLTKAKNKLELILDAKGNEGGMTGWLRKVTV